VVRLSFAAPAADAAVELDLGNIVTFERVTAEGSGAWRLSCDWGTALVIEPHVSFSPVG
jgi:hypothetical protein